ncbi:hypothetical protein F5878DRAFT_620854 [Lentinula raphanica]|uniref:Uncharacterized protein n=1 Tax=Lentinula raphanica TaxID=153919 RepID=A0AA38UDM3_9AGAR|nr:hypothetical protein F5878DRAFT_620854 [Lentinula raphanica]
MKFTLASILYLGITAVCAVPIEETSASGVNLYTDHGARASDGLIASTDDALTRYWSKASVRAAKRDAIDISIAEREVVSGRSNIVDDTDCPGGFCH